MIKKIALLIILCTTFFLQAQEPVYVHFSEKNGLPDKEFYNIIEDSKGFIWLCADKGLFRYNGKTYKNYSNKLQRGLSIFNVQEDNSGRIWCNNISGQFFYIQDNKLKLFTDLSKLLKGELADFIVKEKYLWLFTNYTIYKINLKTKNVEQIQTQPKTKKETLKRVFGAPLKFDDTIYFSNIDSIYSITANNKLKTILPLNLPFYKNGQKINIDGSTIFQVDSTLFLTQKRNEINTFFKINAVKHYAKKVNDFNAIANERIYYQFENNSEIWFATNSGVWVYERIETFFKLKKRFLKNNDVTKIIKDTEANYWFTTLNDGIYVIPNINIETAAITKENKNISSLDIVNDSTLVFGNINGNIGFYNTLTNTVNNINLPGKERVSIVKYYPQKKTVFISKDFGGYQYNIASSKIKEFKLLLTAKSITILNKNNILFTNDKSTAIIDELGYKKEYDSFFNKYTRTYASHYNTINNTVYVAYFNNLYVYDSLWNSKPILYNNKPILGKSISQTKNGVLWVATFKDGVFGIKNDNVIKHYTTKNGLTSNNIGKIKADQNKLWITLNNSIQLLDINTEALQTLTKRDGVISYDVSGIETLKSKVYFSSNEGLFSINKDQPFKNTNPEVYFNKVEINEKDTLVTSNYTLKYNQNAIKIGFNVNGFSYNKKKKYKYRLKEFNNQWLTTDSGINTVKYNSLPPGNYVFQVQPILDGLEAATNKIKSIAFTIAKPFWKTWWFVLAIFGLILASIILYYRKKMKIKEKERLAEIEKISIEKELIAINLTALRSQMNPHFIFNALNSIQDLILKQDTEASYDYIVLFAQLVRNTLTYSSQDFISIEKELEFLNVYLQLEKLRFGDAFNYSIIFNENESLEVPSLLIQPFIENALVHGLMHKSGKKELHITFILKKNVFQCTIIDNGIGRVKSTQISNRQGNHHESFALQAIEKRLEIFKKQHAQNIGYVIEDLYKNEKAIGTKVILTMPYKNRF